MTMLATTRTVFAFLTPNFSSETFIYQVIVEQRNIFYILQQVLYSLP